MCQVIKGLVSVIIPAYNLEQFIGRTLDSVINQEYRDVEILVINDGSTDGTQTIIEEYQQKDSRIKGLYQSNGGAAKARNYGISESHGEFMTFLDGDDMLSSDAISGNIGYLDNDPDLDWVSFSIIRVDNDNNPIDVSGFYQSMSISHIKVLQADGLIEAFRQKLLSGVCCGAIYRKSSIDGIRFPEGEYYEDSFFFTRLLVKTSKCLISSTGSYRYVLRVGSSQLQIKDAPRLRSGLRCELERLRLFREKFPEYEDYYKHVEGELYYYFKTAFAKGIPGSETIFNDLCSSVTSRPKINLYGEIKIALYRIVGYNNLKSIYKIVKGGLRCGFG